jgi:hypothetical protein
MNIFVLSEDPIDAARDLCNKHICKMLIESAQIMSTVYRQVMEERWGLSSRDQAMFPRLYKSTHGNHPAVKWVKGSVHNTEWLWQHLLGIEKEYNDRYNRDRRKHYKAWDVIRELDGIRFSIWKEKGDWHHHTPFVQCMPERYRGPDAVLAYRAYYRGEKAKFAVWQPHAKEPDWWMT